MNTSNSTQKSNSRAQSQNHAKRVSVDPIQTSVFHRGESLNQFLRTHLENRISEGVVIAVTSKIVSIAENRLVDVEAIEKSKLVRDEADHYLGEGGFGIDLTIKHGILIPSSGIDESNSESGQYILFPENPFASAASLHRYLKEAFQLENLGIIITDSHTMPLRRGVTGIALAHYGIQATRSLVGTSDLFGRSLKFTSVDVIDSLAAMAVFVMGEADDCCPIAVIENAKVEFQDGGSADEIAIPLTEDLYYPLLRPALRAAARDEKTP